MEIPNDLTRKQIFTLIMEQLDRIDEKHGPHECPAASIGYALEEFNEVVDEMRLSKGKVSAAVIGEWIDLAVVCVRACDLYMHKPVVIGIDPGSPDGDKTIENHGRRPW